MSGPKRGTEDLFALTCNFEPSPGELCDGPGDFHILFEPPAAEGVLPHPGISCIEHVDTARKFDPFQVHPMMSNCQMPGSLWDMDLNE